MAWRKKVLLQDKDDNLLCFDEFRNSVVLVEHSDSGVGHAVSDSTLIIAALGGEEVQIEIKIKNNRLYRISKNFTFKSEEIPKGVASRLANYVIGSCLNCVWEDIVASTLLPSPTTAPGNEQKHEGLSSESNSPESK
ncbi:MAG: hypothetical protein FJ267_17875 [Planctomycetes bacterium]|nr:hypothetical protein [Planctomycetota bacterium]